MEYLDIYDENKKYIGIETRDNAHKNALWHNTVHCWLYNSKGEVYFQIRKDEKTFYTTASGHVLAGETIKEAFGRELKEELGIKIDYNNAILVGINKFKMDKQKSDGSIFKDRAFSNVYVYEYNENPDKFIFDSSEVDGVVLVKAKEVKKLFEIGYGEIDATIIITEANRNIATKRKVNFNEFLVNKGETAIEKYSAVLDKVIELT